MKSMLILVVALTAMAICIVNAQDPVCDSPDITQEKCNEYTDMGAIYASFEGVTEGLTVAEIESFKYAIANYSSEYVLLGVSPAEVMIVEQGNDLDTGYTTVRFFVLNPSRSTYMPVAFRSQELYLMVKLNNAGINDLSGLTVIPQAPPSAYPLVVPAWGIAIMGYVGLIIIIYCVMVLTRDWRRKKAAEYEAELEKQYYENNSNNLAMKNIASENNYDIVDELPRKKNMTTIGVQTPRHVAIQCNPGDIVKSAVTASTTQVIIENGHASSDAPPLYDNAAPLPPKQPLEKESPTHSADSTDTADIVPMSSSGDIGKDEVDAAAAIEGAINEGFLGDEGDQRPQSVISTTL